VNIHEAKTNFSKLIAEVEGGREILITRAGKPVAKLVPTQAESRRTPGGWENRVKIAPDFDELDPGTRAAFENGGGT
jgi:prevent-host-death family protein